MERVTPKHPAGDLALARFHHHAGRYAEAEALYRRVLTDSRLGPAGAEGLIWVMLRQDRPGDAWAVCDDLEKRFPGQKGRVAFWRGQIAARRGDWGGAVRHFETALRSDPASEEIQWALAEAFCEKGENQACIARLTFLLEEGSRSFRDRREASARLLLGRALEREGRIQDSLLQYMKAASLDPRNRDVVAAVERLRRSL